MSWIAIAIVIIILVMFVRARRCCRRRGQPPTAADDPNVTLASVVTFYQPDDLAHDDKGVVFSRVYDGGVLEGPTEPGPVDIVLVDYHDGARSAVPCCRPAPQRSLRDDLRRDPLEGKYVPDWVTALD